MLFLNKNEENIICNFLKHEREYINKDLDLRWENKGGVIAKYKVLLEDESDYEIGESEYEELWSFGFNLVEIYGAPPISVNHQNNFLINYHNFPDEIIFDGKKINWIINRITGGNIR